MAKPLQDQFSELLDSYNMLLKRCYDALAEGVEQDERDALRNVLADFID